MTSTALLAMFLLLLIVPGVNASLCTYNENSGDGRPHTIMDIQQLSFLVADNLEFQCWISPGDIRYHITGWRIEVTDFPSCYCDYADEYEQIVQVDTWGDNIPKYTTVTIDARLWVDPYHNEMDIYNYYWSEGSVLVKALPDHGWVVRPPTERVYIYNKDPLVDFTIYDFKWRVSTTYYSNLKVVPFDHTEPGNFLIEHGLSKSFTTPFGGLTDDAYLYFHYKMQNAIGDDVMELWASHNIEAAVGGFLVPVDKFGLLAPYIGLASTIVVATVATAIYAKRRKEKR